MEYWSNPNHYKAISIHAPHEGVRTIEDKE